MKKIYIVISVLVILILSFLIVRPDKDIETSENNINDAGVISNEMPALGDEGNNVEEMLVVKEFTISGKNFSFAPSTIKVEKGTRVKITFQNSAGFHDFVVEGYSVATKQPQSPATEVLEFTADKMGTFEYYCSVGTHRAMGMKGMLIVE